MDMQANNKSNVIVWTDPGKYSMLEILLAHGTKCHLCGKDIDFAAPRRVGYRGWENALHLDHVLPLSKGGSDELENVKPSHGYCNIKKSGMRKPAISKYLPPSKIKI